MRWGFTKNEKSNASWLLGSDEEIKNALEFIKENDIHNYESIVANVENNYAKKDKISAYIDNAVIVAPILNSVVKKTHSKYEIEDKTNDLLTLKRMICYDKTIVVDGKYKIIDSTCFLLTPNVENMIFEEGIEFIKDYALCQTEKLKSIVFPKSLKIISSLAFQNCPNLSSIEFKNPNTKYYDSTFAGSMWSNK